MPTNLGLALGQPCQSPQSFDPSMLTPPAQLALATNVPVGEGWLTQRGQVVDRFAVICLKLTLVIAPQDSTRILRLLDGVIPNIPWARSTGTTQSWCGPSYACSGTGPSGCGTKPWSSVYPDWRQEGVCLPQYDHTQRPSGRASTFCWNTSNAQWADFWKEVSTGIRRFNS